MDRSLGYLTLVVVVSRAAACVLEDSQQLQEQKHCRLVTAAVLFFGYKGRRNPTSWPYTPTRRI
jgi:hypothetical protein